MKYGLNHSTVIELPSDKFMPLRDYAILSKSLIFYEEDVNDSSFREKIFSSMDEGGRILGWGPDEHRNVSISSKYRIDMIAADWSYNLSVLSSYKCSPQSQKIDNNFKEEDGVHYVTFIMSDGDNMQWLLGSNFTMKNWSNNKPIISCRDLLWSGLEDEDQLITNIYTKINSGYTNIKDPNSYTFVYVHVWSNTMDNVNDVVNKLNKNSKVRIVSPDTFIKLIINNVPHVDT